MTYMKWEKDEEFLSYITDLLETEEVQKLKDITQHYYSTRLDHSISVAYRSYCIAKRFKCDVRAIARAGLLHDLFYYDWRTTKFDEGSHAYVHPRIACENAGKLTELSDLEKDIILKHMWGATIALPKYKESYIVTLVDKYCACDEALSPFFVKTKENFRGKWALIKRSILTNTITF
ncbi:HD domain-containing protein [Jeotgalibaca ciconiae]|uniref:HD domain-containing protein n=1 Tax=Jeotgalibaca ciconiae TaxID=2496265 RepID=A0A3S9HDX3_9LACT|nr:HD domain-containing protein [Jeotgalibaca ciconiae]AZP05531.1 HD domain-containing protein [Jeotgalibaca ciconiae]HJB22622.1 HD domain-containing protein [Candidatus Jeotgalibaca pullicola]